MNLFINLYCERKNSRFKNAENMEFGQNSNATLSMNIITSFLIYKPNKDAKVTRVQDASSPTVFELK